MSSERRTLAQRYIDFGRNIIERQRQLIAQGEQQGRNTRASEELLASFNRTQATFEHALAAMTNQRPTTITPSQQSSGG